MALKKSDITTTSGLTSAMKSALQTFVKPASSPTPLYYNQKEFDALGFAPTTEVAKAKMQALALAPSVAASYASNAQALSAATASVEHALDDLKATITQLDQSMMWSTLSSDWISDGSVVHGQGVEKIVPSLVFGAPMKPNTISTQGSVTWLSKNGVCALPLPPTPAGCSFCAWARDCTLQCECGSSTPTLDLATCILQDTSWLKGECAFMGSDAGKGLTCYAPLPNFHGTKRPLLTVNNVSGHLQCASTNPLKSSDGG